MAGGESAGDFGGTLAALLDTGLVADVAPADITTRQPAVIGGKPLPDATAQAETLPFWSPGVAFVQVPVAATADIKTDVPAAAAAAALTPVALGTSALTPAKSPLASSLVGGGGEVPIEGPDPAPVENRLPPPSERVIRIGLRGAERPTTAKRPRDSDATDDTPTEHATIPGAAATAVPVVTDAPKPCRPPHRRQRCPKLVSARQRWRETRSPGRTCPARDRLPFSRPCQSLYPPLRLRATPEGSLLPFSPGSPRQRRRIRPPSLRRQAAMPRRRLPAHARHLPRLPISRSPPRSCRAPARSRFPTPPACQQGKRCRRPPLSMARSCPRQRRVRRLRLRHYRPQLPQTPPALKHRHRDGRHATAHHP
ncbi:hypothetical protein QP185_07375 [Sphingomonas aerolata]|uniref:hypothetical protein n=1 Tax=Sphingomonas aerolata TaxID=185951 RepID=UPI002FE2C71E